LRAATIGSIVRFLIRKRSFRQAPANDRFWPKVDLRRHRKNARLCDSHEGLESTRFGRSSSLTLTAAIGLQSSRLIVSVS
jgi:hypothetical protein